MPEQPGLNLALQVAAPMARSPGECSTRCWPMAEWVSRASAAPAPRAMNAIALADGWLKGGADGARQSLETFWLAIADSSPFSSQGDDSDSPPTALKLMLGWTDYLTPEQLNPLDLNPLRDIVTAHFDFAALRRDTRHKLFIAATHANTGKLRLFRNAELSAEALLASACLPMLHRTVIIDGEPYWDGGYSGQSRRLPAAVRVPGRGQSARAADAATPRQHAVHRPRYPAPTARNVVQRHFSAGNADVRPPPRTHRAQCLPGLAPPLAAGIDARPPYRRGALSCHLGGCPDHALPSDSKLTVNRSFSLRLRDQGRTHAQGWLAGNHAAIGRRSTLDLARALLLT